MAKTHISLRIEEQLSARVSGMAEPGESMAATYNRVIRAGVEALEQPAGAEPDSAAQDAAAALIAAKDAHIAALEATLATLDAQLNTKDEQIEHLAKLTDQAQRLHALTAPETKAIAAESQTFKGEEQDAPQGLFERWMNKRGWRRG